MPDRDAPLTRRSLLTGLGAIRAGLALGELAGCSSGSSGAAHSPTSSASTSVPQSTPATTAAATPIRAPGARPNPPLPAGTDTLPQIEHIVVVMMENHSFDDHYGMLGRGDGFLLDAHGLPRDANPNGSGGFVPAFPMPPTSPLQG